LYHGSFGGLEERGGNHQEWHQWELHGIPLVSNHEQILKKQGKEDGNPDGFKKQMLKENLVINYENVQKFYKQ